MVGSSTEPFLCQTVAMLQREVPTMASKKSTATSSSPTVLPDSEMITLATQPRAHDSPRRSGGRFSPKSFDFRVQIHDIAGGVQQLRANGREDSWMAFLFDTGIESAKTGDRDLALQYSIIDGRLGLDWVLIAPRNVADQDDVAQFMRDCGHEVALFKMNEVEFLRVEDGDLAALGEHILNDMYRVPPTAELGLLIDGIYLSSGKRTQP